MYIKKFPNRDKKDSKVYICRSVPGKKKRENLEIYPSFNKLKEEHGDADAFLQSRIEELSATIGHGEAEKLSITIDFNRPIDFSEGEYKAARNAGYLFLQKAYFDLGIDPFLNKWKFTSGTKIGYSLNDAFRFLVFARVEDPCSKLAVSRKGKDYLEDFSLTADNLYDCLDRIDCFSEALTRKLSGKCREAIGSKGTAVYYDCTNFYFEIQKADEEGKGIRAYGVEKNHRPDPIVEYGLLMDESGYPIGSTTFRGGKSERNSLVPLLDNAGEEATKAKIIVADNGLNCESNKKAIHEAGRNYIFCQSPKQLSEDNLAPMFDGKGWLEYGEGKKVKSWWIIRTNKREERLVARFDKASYDFMNAVIDDRVKRAMAFIEKPSKLTYANCQDGKQYIKKIAVDKKTGEVLKAKSVLELKLDEIEKDRKYAGYILYVTDIPREKDDADGKFAEMKKNGYRVEFKEDLGIVEIAGRRNDIEACFETMKSGMDARPIFVRKESHIKAHLFTVYVALTLLMYMKQKYVHDMTSESLLCAIRKYCLCSIGDYGDVYATGYYSRDVDQLARSMGFTGLDRKYLSKKTVKKTIALSKECS